MSRLSWNGHSNGNSTWCFFRIGIHLWNQGSTTTAISKLDNHHFSWKIYAYGLKRVHSINIYFFTFCTILLTTDARSRGHDILNTLGPGHGITDNSNTIKTWKTHFSSYFPSYYATIFCLSRADLDVCMPVKKVKLSRHRWLFIASTSMISFSLLRLFVLYLYRCAYILLFISVQIENDHVACGIAGKIYFHALWSFYPFHLLRPVVSATKFNPRRLKIPDRPAWISFTISNGRKKIDSAMTQSRTRSRDDDHSARRCNKHSPISSLLFSSL